MAHERRIQWKHEAQQKEKGANQMLGGKKQGKLVGKQFSEQYGKERAQTSELGRPLN